MGGSGESKNPSFRGSNYASNASGICDTSYELRPPRITGQESTFPGQIIEQRRVSIITGPIQLRLSGHNEMFAAVCLSAFYPVPSVPSGGRHLFVSWRLVCISDRARVEGKCGQLKCLGYHRLDRASGWLTKREARRYFWQNNFKVNSSEIRLPPNMLEYRRWN